MFCTYDVRVTLLKLLQEVGRLEVLGHGVVEARNHLVDGFLPRLFGVLAALDGLEEFAQRLLDHEPEVGGHLRKEPAVSQTVASRGGERVARSQARWRQTPVRALFFAHILF